MGINIIIHQPTRNEILFSIDLILMHFNCSTVPSAERMYTASNAFSFCTIRSPRSVNRIGFVSWLAISVDGGFIVVYAVAVGEFMSPSSFTAQLAKSPNKSNRTEWIRIAGTDGVWKGC